MVGELETVVFGQGLNYKFLVALGEALAVDNYSVSSTVSGARQREGQRGIHLAASVSLVARTTPPRRRVAGRLAELGQKLEKKARSDRFSQK